MKYYDGYKFVVGRSFAVKTSIFGYEVTDKLTKLTKDGKLFIDEWYPWDGNSGPLPDFKSTIDASCAHDVLCDYVNMGWLPKDLQPLIDQEYYKLAVRDGLWEWVARIALVVIRWYQTGKPKAYRRKLLST
jgi:hypothetical protein